MQHEFGSVNSVLTNDELIVDATWRDMGGFAHFEPSIRVVRDASADRDGDTVGPLTAIFRKVEWRKNGALASPRLARLQRRRTR